MSKWAPKGQKSSVYCDKNQVSELENLRMVADPGSFHHGITSKPSSISDQFFPMFYSLQPQKNFYPKESIYCFFFFTLLENLKEGT